MTDGWSQISPSDDITDYALVEESGTLAAGGEGLWKTHPMWHQSSEHEVLSPAEGNQ